MLRVHVPKFLIISFIILNIGIFLLGYYYLNKKEIRLDNLEEFVGQYVIVKGDVLESRLSKSGKSYVMKIFDGYGYAFIVHKYSEYNDCKRIMAKGIVSEFRGNFYIFVNKKRDIICLK